MMMILGIALAWIAGMAVVRWLWVAPGAVNKGMSWIVRAALALAVGLGIESLLQFAGLLVFNQSARAWPVAEAASVLATIVLLLSEFFVRRNKTEMNAAELHQADSKSSKIGEQSADRRSIRTLLIAAASLVTLVLAGVGAWCQSLSYKNYPHGDWDAWAIWNARARFLYLSGEQWRLGYAQALQWSHPDYPLLVPLNVVRIWHFYGEDSTLGPTWFQAIFWLGLPAMLFASVGRLRGPLFGFAAVFCLASNNAFWVQGEAQIADLPLSMYMLGTIVVFAHCLAADSADRRRLAALCGLLSGCAAWTKNEGLLFALVIGVAIVGIFIRRRDWLAIGAWLVGAAPFVASNLVVKHLSAATNDVVAGQSVSRTLTLIFDLGRHVLILRTIVEKLIEFPAWGIALVGVVAAWFTLSGPRNNRSDRNLLVLSACVAAQAGAYYMVYLLTPRDLAWHLGTSIDRLILHLWPMFLFIAFIGMDAVGAREPVTLRR